MVPRHRCIFQVWSGGLNSALNSSRNSSFLRYRNVLAIFPITRLAFLMHFPMLLENMNSTLYIDDVTQRSFSGVIGSRLLLPSITLLKYSFGGFEFPRLKYDFSLYSFIYVCACRQVVVVGSATSSETAMQACVLQCQ